MNRAGSSLQRELSLNKVYSCLGSLHVIQGCPRKCQMRSFHFYGDKIRLGLMSQRSAVEGPGHKLYTVAVPTNLPTEHFSRDSQTSCQTHHHSVVLCSLCLSAYPGFTFRTFALSWLSWHPCPQLPQ